MTLVSVVIPVLNQWHLTERCLRTLAEHSPGDIRVVVVDNASSDETGCSCPALGKALFGPRFTFLRQEANLNFGPASNLGASHVRDGFLLFLNNDTELRPGWLPPLISALDNPKIGAAGPRLLYPDGRVQHVGTAFTPQLGPTHIFEHFPGDHPAALARRRCQAITAAALCIRAGLFRELDGFYPEFRNGSEDLDLCARIRARGLQLAVCPESTVIHHTSQSAGRFDHDGANAALLRSRQAQAFVPDLHLFARQAGYRLRLTPWLTPFMAPPGQTFRVENQMDLGELQKALLKEPLWEDGYGLLANAALDAGDHALALEGLFLCSQFFPSVENYRRLQRTATGMGAATLAGDVAQKIRIIEAILADRPKLARTAQTLAARFKAAGQPELHALYRDWLAEFAHAT